MPPLVKDIFGKLSEGPGEEKPFHLQGILTQPRTQGFCAYCSQKPWDNPNRNTIEHWCPRKRK